MELLLDTVCSSSKKFSLFFAFVLSSFCAPGLLLSCSLPFCFVFVLFSFCLWFFVLSVFVLCSFLFLFFVLFFGFFAVMVFISRIVQCSLVAFTRLMVYYCFVFAIRQICSSSFNFDHSKTFRKRRTSSDHWPGGKDFRVFSLDNVSCQPESSLRTRRKCIQVLLLVICSGSTY